MSQQNNAIGQKYEKKCCKQTVTTLHKFKYIQMHPKSYHYILALSVTMGIHKLPLRKGGLL